MFPTKNNPDRTKYFVMKRTINPRPLPPFSNGALATSYNSNTQRANTLKENLRRN